MWKSSLVEKLALSVAGLENFTSWFIDTGNEVMLLDDVVLVQGECQVVWCYSASMAGYLCR